MSAGTESAKQPVATESKWMEDFRTLLAGYITGSVVRLAVHPIDTIKARMQVIKSRVSFGQMSQHSFRKVLGETFRADGVRGLYRGFGVTVLAGGPATGLYFYTYEKTKAALTRVTGAENSFIQGFISGMVAEFFSCVLWVPIDVLKERLQVMSLLKSYNYKNTKIYHESSIELNTLDAMGQISRSEGFRSLYRAYGATVLSFGPFSGISMATYDKLKYWLVKDPKQQSYLQSFLLSAISGAVASIVTHPMDIVKVRMQVQRAEGKGQPLEQGRFGYRNVFHGMGKLVRDEGPFALFKGLSARMLFGVMFSALHLSVNDWVKYKLLGTSKSN